MPAHCRISLTFRNRIVNQTRRMATSSSMSSTFELSDGRKLGYAEYGIPSGKPVLYFHGYPSSRLEASVADEIAKRHNIRLIALDRPGFGLSTPQPHRRLLDWAVDVRTFAEGLNLPRFAVMGLSGGGPYALACASALPKGMLTGVGLFASGPPWVAGSHYMSVYRRVFAFLAQYCPNTLRVGMDALVRVLVCFVNIGPVVSWMNRWLEEADKKKRASTDSNEMSKDPKPATIITTEDRRQNLLGILLYEPFAQGSEAAVHEALLLSSNDWGFRFENIEYDTVQIWHGAKDKNAPAVAMRYLAERLPHCAYTEFEEDTHYTMWPHFEGALASLIMDEKSQ